MPWILFIQVEYGLVILGWVLVQLKHSEYLFALPNRNHPFNFGVGGVRNGIFLCFETYISYSILSFSTYE